MTFAPGAMIVARDEEWLITQVEETRDGSALSVQGISELVRGQDAVFLPWRAKICRSAHEPLNFKDAFNSQTELVSPAARRAYKGRPALPAASIVPL